MPARSKAPSTKPKPNSLARRLTYIALIVGAIAFVAAFPSAMTGGALVIGSAVVIAQIARH